MQDLVPKERLTMSKTIADTVSSAQADLENLVSDLRGLLAAKELDAVPQIQQLRQRLRKWHGAPRDGKAFGIASVFSRESVQHPTATGCETTGSDGSLNCHGYGSSVTVTATFGLCAAGWVLQQLARQAAASP